MRENSWLDNVVWGLLLLFLIPSGLVVASWNSLPGSRLYRVKILMEDALLVVTPTVEAKGSLHVAFTERRFSEAQKLLVDQSSTAGLVYLNDQVLQAKQNIQNAKDPVVKKQMAKTYIATLKNVNAQLEQQKQVIAAGGGQQAAYQPPPQPTVIIRERVVVQQQPIIVNNYIQQVVTATPTHTPIPTHTPTPSPLPAVVQNYIDNHGLDTATVIAQYQAQFNGDIGDLEAMAEGGGNGNGNGNGGGNGGEFNNWGNGGD